MDIISRIIPELNDIIGQLVGWIHSWVPTYGIAVIVFTLFLKILTFPLDYWQRYGMRKNSLLQKKLKPLTDQIDHKCEDQRQAAQEKQALMKKYGYSMMSGCLPMLIMMVIFFVMFNGFRTYSNYSSILVYNKLVDSFNTSYIEMLPTDEREAFIAEIAQFDEQIKALEASIAEKTLELETANEADKPLIENELTELRNLLTQKREGRTEVFNEKNRREALASDFASEQVGKTFDENRESFFWVKNIYRADSSQSVFPSYSDTAALLSTSQKANFSEEDYNVIYRAVSEKSEAGQGYFSGHWNGLFILPILSIALSILSSLVSQRLNRVKGEQLDPQAQKTNRTMMFLMPVMLAFFVFSYTAAFAIYMVSSSLISMLVGFAITPIINKRASKKVEADFISREPSYSRNKKEK